MKIFTFHNVSKGSMTYKTWDNLKESSWKTSTQMVEIIKMKVEEVVQDGVDRIDLA
jgi:hypothetical protein